MSRKLIALDDGHGMETGGKRTPPIPSLGNRVIRENEFNREVVKYLDAHLRSSGFDTVLLAPTDADTPLKQRTDLANSKKADFLISVHFNAQDEKFSPTGNDPEGFSAHIQPGARNGAAGKMAQLLLNHLSKGTNQRNRGIVEQNLHMTREAKMPAVLLELGFMDNPREALLMIDVSFQKECAEEIARAICEYYGVPFSGGAASGGSSSGSSAGASTPIFVPKAVHMERHEYQFGRKDSVVDLEDDYVKRVTYMSQIARERAAWLSTFVIPGFETKVAGVSTEDGAASTASTDISGMSVNMDGVPLPNNEFLKKILPGAIKAYAKYNILPSVTLGQATLESGWGKKGIGNNIFGIKATKSWTGKTKMAWTSEEVNGISGRYYLEFRDYDSIDDCILDHGKLVGEASRYEKVRAAKDYKEAARALKAAGYATDSRYDTKLISCIESKSDPMYLWDKPEYKNLVDFKPAGTASGSTPAAGGAAKIVELAKSWLNKKTTYVWGGGRTEKDIQAGKFDCSAWVSHVMKQAGYPGVPAQTKSIINSDKYTTVTTNQLQPGDMMFFDTTGKNGYGHVTIYLGDGVAIGCQNQTGVASIFYQGNSYWQPKISNMHKRIKY